MTAVTLDSWRPFVSEPVALTVFVSAGSGTCELRAENFRLTPVPVSAFEYSRRLCMHYMHKAASRVMLKAGDDLRMFRVFVGMHLQHRADDLVRSAGEALGWKMESKHAFGAFGKAQVRWTLSLESAQRICVEQPIDAQLLRAVYCDRHELMSAIDAPEWIARAAMTAFWKNCVYSGVCMTLDLPELSR